MQNGFRRFRREGHLVEVLSPARAAAVVAGIPSILDAIVDESSLSTNSTWRQDGPVLSPAAFRKRLALESVADHPARKIDALLPGAWAAAHDE
jgi:hypothetical protein